MTRAERACKQDSAVSSRRPCQSDTTPPTYVNNADTLWEQRNWVTAIAIQQCSTVCCMHVCMNNMAGPIKKKSKSIFWKVQNALLKVFYDRKREEKKNENKCKMLNNLRVGGHNLGQQATCFAKKMRHVSAWKKVAKGWQKTKKQT